MATWLAWVLIVGQGVAIAVLLYAIRSFGQYSESVRRDVDRIMETDRIVQQIKALRVKRIIGELTASDAVAIERAAQFVDDFAHLEREETA